MESESKANDVVGSDLESVPNRVPFLAKRNKGSQNPDVPAEKKKEGADHAAGRAAV